jgi:hypothetical protein
MYRYHHQGSSDSSSAFREFSADFLNLFIGILKSDANEVYKLVPHPTFITPTLPQLNQNVDPNSNYSLKEIAFDFGHLCARLFLILFQALLVSLQQDATFPRFAINIMDDSLLTTSLLPYAKMMSYSFSMLTEKPPPFAFTISLIEDSLKWHFTLLNFHHWGKAFAEWLLSDARFVAIFLGHDPYNNSNVKAMANIGSQFFDSMSVIFATAYQIGNTKRTNNEAAPNGTLVEMYDTLVKYHNVTDDPTSALARNWNNKGNSMETLAMTMLENEKHPLLWFNAFITLHASYQDSAMPNIRQI